MMLGLGNILGSFGTIPDIIMGKDPKTALLDNMKAAAVVGSGMAAPGLLGTAGTAGAGTATASAANAAPGLLSTVSEYAKPISQAVNAASSVRGLLSPQQTPMQAPMQMPQMGGGQTLAALAGQNQQASDNQMQMAEQARIARRNQFLKGGLL